MLSQLLSKGCAHKSNDPSHSTPVKKAAERPSTPAPEPPAPATTEPMAATSKPLPATTEPLASVAIGELADCDVSDAVSAAPLDVHATENSGSAALEPDDGELRAYDESSAHTHKQQCYRSYWLLIYSSLFIATPLHGKKYEWTSYLLSDLRS